MKMKSKIFLTANSVETAHSHYAHVGPRPENVFSHLIGSIRNSKLWGGFSELTKGDWLRIMGLCIVNMLKNDLDASERSEESTKRDLLILFYCPSGAKRARSASY